jgi:hypothetical protein
MAHLTRFEEDFALIGSDGGRTIIGSLASIHTQGHPLPVALSPPVTTDRDPKPIVDVVFNEPSRFTGKPVIETLVDLTNCISQLISPFEIAFL